MSKGFLPQDSASSDSLYRSVIKILNNTMGITRLSPLDEPRIRRAFRGKHIRYAYSWLYILRASHLPDGEPGYVCIRDDLIATVGYRHGCIYILPIFDSTYGTSLQALCESIASVTDVPIIIKKFDTALHPLTSVSKDNDLPLEDDTCPETYLDLKKYFQPNGRLNPALTKLEQRARSFEQSGTAIEAVHDLRQVPLKKLEHFLARDTEKYLNYVSILRYLYGSIDTSSTYSVTVFVDSENVRGLYMAERLNMSTIGLYGGITTKDEGGITEWMDLNFFSHMYDQKIGRVLLGGAENAGIAAYVSRLVPYKPGYSAESVQFSSKQFRPKGVRIRQAAEQDIRQIANLYLNVYNSIEELGETWTKESAHKFISHFYRRQPDLFFVAETEHTVIGAIVAGIQPWWDGNHLVEGELFVKKIPSNESIADLLLKRLLRESNERYGVVTWDTIMPTVRNHPFARYKQLGFKKVRQWEALSGDVADILARMP